MTFVDEIQKTEKEVQSILDKAKEESDNIRKVADAKREKTLGDLHVELSQREKNAIQDVERKIETEKESRATKSKDILETLVESAAKNKKKAMDFVLKNLQ